MHDVQKFDRLYDKQHAFPPPPPGNVIVNLTDYKLDDPTISILTKGLDYAIAPKRIPVEDIIVQVESAIKPLSAEQSELIR